MEFDILFGGIGGQGIQLATQVLAQAATLEGKNVLQYCDYSSEMRGGKIDCTVVVAPPDEEIGSPRRTHPRAAVAMSPRACQEYRETLSTGGVLILNTSIVNGGVDRTDVHVLAVPTLRLAEEIGEPRAVSMIALGALIARTGVVSLDMAADALRVSLPSHRQTLIAANERALRCGAAFVTGPGESSRS